MTTYFMYCNESSTTGKELAEMLSESGVDSGTGPSEKYDLLIRWGTQAKVPYKPGRVLNGLGGIANASNKLKALVMMRDAGVNIPAVYQGGEQVNSVKFPVLGRKIKHTGGKDIVLCLQKSDLALAESDYFVEYIPVAHEYRVHVFKGQAIKISEKVLTNLEIHTKNWVRNFDNGYTFKQPATKPKAAAVGMAIDAVDCLGLDFGAVDLVVSDNGSAFVLEVNTAPGLTTDTSQSVYIDRFKAEIEAMN